MTATITEEAFHVPNLVTKNLKLGSVNGGKRVRISSNWISLLGLTPGSRLAAVPSYDGGFNVMKSDEGPYKVHTRRYKRGRRNNPLESVVEFSSSELMATLPPSTERFRVEMRQGGLLKVRPLPNRVFNIIKQYKEPGRNPLSSLVAFTGGVDAYALAELGFSPEVILEWRPPEARDMAGGRFRDLSEVHALNVVRNVRAPRAVINEDIYRVDPLMLKRVCEEAGGTAVAHYSICCDDFSTSKSPNAKAKSIQNQDTTIDQIWPVLRQVEEIGFPVVVVENVAPFEKSQAGEIFMSMLQRWGYHLTPMTLNALDYGGIQGRRRFYLVASVFPGFEQPAMESRNNESIWPMIERRLSECRDVSDANFVRNRESSHRKVPMLTEKSTSCATILKSQCRGIKDQVLIAHKGRVLAPSEGLIKDLMGIPDAFDVSWMASEQAIETLGQSIDVALHKKVMQSVKAHVELNLGRVPTLAANHQASLF